MTLLLVCVAALFGTGLLALIAGRTPRMAGLIGAGGVVAACAVGLPAAAAIMLSGGDESFHCAWELPVPNILSLRLDSLSAFFLVPVLLLSALAAVYGTDYLARTGHGRPLGSHWFFFNVLVASMVLVLLAANGVLFLMSWELMAVSSFFLVTFEDEQPRVRQAGWTYLVATHAGTACLIPMFVLLGRGSGDLGFAAFASGGGALSPSLAAAVFLLAIVGFGTKAGFMPMHIWLPEAHPAAPTHVSAVMSGVMIKTGIYGLLRVLTFLGAPPLWWGAVMLAIGLSSGILGVLLALAQHDLKRLLAYHSIENIGIIAMGIGIGLLGLSSGAVFLAALGFGGALLHVVNHALFKGLLFLGAGSVYAATGTREIDRLGGLIKRMPLTAATFLVGAVAISGLPPLNGFVSEFMLYLAALRGSATLAAPALAVPLLAVILGLALIGGLAAACFAKAFGIVFLGEPRSERPAAAVESGPRMTWAMLVLAACCLAIGLAAPRVVTSLTHPLAVVCGLPREDLVAALRPAALPLAWIAWSAAALLLLIAALAAVRRRLLAGRPVAAAATWGCGYAQPTARMQYTASSFAKPLLTLFGPLLGSRVRAVLPKGLFPREATAHTDTHDMFRERMFAPSFRVLERLALFMRWLQQGSVHLYVLYIVVALVVLLIAALRLQG